MRMNMANAITPLVSVVLPTYMGDEPRLLWEAASSILAQTWKHLELIIVLDGPVGLEACAAIEALERADARVRIIALDANQGPAHARNAGIAAAHGEYIALLDADDRAAPRRIEQQVRHMAATGADVAGSWHRIVDERGAVLGRKQTPVSPCAVRRWMPFINPIANSTVLARAAVLRENPFPEGPRAKGRAFDGEDYALWVALALQGRVLCNVPEELADFRADAGFLERRRGLGPFRSDLRTKLKAAALYPI